MMAVLIRGGLVAILLSTACLLAEAQEAPPADAVPAEAADEAADAPLPDETAESAEQVAPAPAPAPAPEPEETSDSGEQAAPTPEPEAPAPVDASQGDGAVVAITNAKAWTGTDAGTLEGATIIITDGTISAVGPDVAVPDGAMVIDAGGNWVTPGIIAPFSQIGLVEVGAEDTTNDTAGAMTPYSVALMAVDGFNPLATPVAASRIEGITRVVVAPSAGLSMFAGQGFTADTTGELSSVMDDDAFVYVRFGEAGAGVAGGSRSASWTYFRAALADARTFPARFLAHNEGDALTRVDAQALGPASRGQQLIVFEAHRASDLMQIMAFAEDNSALDFAIVGAAEGWLVADELAASGIPVIVNPFDNLPATFQSLAASQENTARLMDAGVTVAIANLDSLGHQARLTLQVAGNAVAHGVPHDDALAAITRVPAEIFGMDGLGTLEAGAVGDVVVWDGDPLEVMSSPDAVIINGEVQSLESRQTRLRDRYLGLENGERPFAYKRNN